ncbi:hypothetical protein ABD91_26025 [Lysinibacillus sphaericus]|uniref:hypothetical protein n=1 Tax=Lysinibacillus sphaericus TaxID=1421 RepID=UPI0018CE97C9|nr:hypothetical protein [Lysinibacillus sphaericus]MBG9694191.1 hypothetical protein [Lysinibacillus sphaericus]
MIIKQTTIQLIKDEVSEFEGTYFENLMAKMQTPYHLINISVWENPVIFRESVDKGAFRFVRSMIVLTDMYPMLFSKQSKRLVSDILMQLSYGQNKVFVILSNEVEKRVAEEEFMKMYFDSIYN